MDEIFDATRDPEVMTFQEYQQAKREEAKRSDPKFFEFLDVLKRMYQEHEAEKSGKKFLKNL